jgi:hypothetical protein
VCPPSYPFPSIYRRGGTGGWRHALGEITLEMVTWDTWWPKTSGWPSLGRCASHCLCSCHLQVGPLAYMGMYSVRLAHLHGVVAPWIHVSSYDWRRVCFFARGKMSAHESWSWKHKKNSQRVIRIWQSSMQKQTTYVYEVFKTSSYDFGGLDISKRSFARSLFLYFK